MVKQIPCRVVYSAFSGSYQSKGCQPPIRHSDFCSSLCETEVDNNTETFPMGMFVDVIIGDN